MDLLQKTLSERLAAGETLIADGATGTMIMAAGLTPGAAPESWNVERPDQIVALHRAYIEAGSQIILTNTFGGSRIKLGKSGLEERARELNLAAAKLARQAASGEAYVVGDLGPSGEMMTPMGPLTYDWALEVFAEQAVALVEGGVDALWVETMTDLDEARAAVNAAKQATNLPVFCSLSFGRKGRTMMGVSPKQAAEALWSLGLVAIGANCGEGLDMVDLVLGQLREALPGAPLIAKSNAGLPKLVNGETVYDTSPHDFAIRVRGFVAGGARLVGACCGSSPEFIREIAGAMTVKSTVTVKKFQ